MSDALPVGTLLLDPGDTAGRPTIWAVTSPLIVTAAVDGVSMRAMLTSAGLPKGWRVIDNRVLARQMRDAPARAVEHILGSVT